MKQTVSGGASASSQSARPGRFARLRRAVATFMGLALSGATAVAAQPAAVPQHWVSLRSCWATSSRPGWATTPIRRSCACTN